MPQEFERRALLPDSLKKPYLLLLTALVPQAALLLLNICFWNLIKGQAADQQKTMALTVLASEIALLLFAGLSWLILRLIHKKINLILCTALFIANIGYLWLLSAWIIEIRPQDVAEWILPTGKVVYYQFALIMPVLFYTGLRIACIDLKINRIVDVAVTVVAMVFVPVFFYVLMGAVSLIHRSAPVAEFFFIIMFIAATVVTLIAFIRVTFYIFSFFISRLALRLILFFVVGVLAPVAGLLLNISIPFPCSFQAPAVYVLAILNGLLLIVGFEHSSKKELLAWLVHCLFYPFTLYFFIVFLPFLPLSLPAMFAAGAGFLILTPTLLFVIHTLKIIREGRTAIASMGCIPCVLIFLVLLVPAPIYFTVTAYSDKAVLENAIDYVYAPDYTADAGDINPASVKRAMENLRDYKDGIYLPFISDLYNRIVFNDMVLPDKKIEEIYKVFVGIDMPEQDENEDFFFLSNRTRRNWYSADAAPPQRFVELSQISTQFRTDNELTSTIVTLEMKNLGGDGSEFVTDIEVPRGVLVTGYWLDVNDTRVPGQIFEKKAAMWVYHMIRDFTRRDPGLLYFESDNKLKLSVFPFDIGQKRKTEIQFTFPSLLNPAIKIQGKSVSLTDNPNRPDRLFRVETQNDNDFIIVSSAVLDALPKISREPYFHFILDASATAEQDYDSFTKLMAKAAEKFPDVKQCRITAANYRSYDITDGLIAIDSLEETIGTEQPTFEGGFCPGRAMKKALINYNSQIFQSPAQATVPFFVVIQSPNTPDIAGRSLSDFEDLSPDYNYYLYTKSNGPSADFEFFKFAGYESYVDSISRAAEPVVIIRSGSATTICVVDSQTKVLPIPADAAGIAYYDPKQQDYIEFTDVLSLPAGSVYSQGLMLWHNYRQTRLSPNTLNDRLAEIVSRCKQSGVLTPLTSYIVVENYSQWQILKQKEKQALGANYALEFEEAVDTPAPPILFLLPALLLFFYRPRKAAA